MSERRMFILVCLVQMLQPLYASNEEGLRGPPKVEQKPNLLDSFIPASMQVIAHLTELMKYDVKPPQGPTTTTTTTVKPTPSHVPGIFSPQNPPGPVAYFAKVPLSYDEYVKRLQQPSSYVNYFDRYYYLEDDSEKNAKNLEIKEVEGYTGANFAEVLKLANRIDPEFYIKNDDVLVQDFSRDFDDSNFRLVLLRQKKVPPTKAYVTLLSLYDMLNKESKRMNLNKYTGYTESVLKELSEASTGTSAYQLHSILSKIVERREILKPDLLKKIKNLISDLDEDNSYINQALRYIPPLPFAL